MTQTPEQRPRLYRWAIGAAIFSCACNILLYLLPYIVPPPEPRGYAPYMFVYNFTYVFPLMGAVVVSFFLSLFSSLAYRSVTRNNGDTNRRRKLLALLLLLIPPGLHILYVIIILVRIALR